MTSFKSQVKPYMYFQPLKSVVHPYDPLQHLIAVFREDRRDVLERRHLPVRGPPVMPKVV